MNVTVDIEIVIETMRELLISRGHQNGAFSSTKNLVSYMEGEEILEMFQKLYPEEASKFHISFEKETL